VLFEWRGVDDMAIGFQSKNCTLYSRGYECPKKDQRQYSITSFASLRSQCIAAIPYAVLLNAFYDSTPSVPCIFPGHPMVSWLSSLGYLDRLNKQTFQLLPTALVAVVLEPIMGSQPCEECHNNGQDDHKTNRDHPNPNPSASALLLDPRVTKHLH